MNKKIKLLVFIVLFGLAGSTCLSAKQYTVALFVPSDKTDLFWSATSSFMQASCNDLGIKLKLYYAKGNRGVMNKQIDQATSGKNKVDAVIFQSFKGQGIRYIKTANKNKVPAFLFNAGVDHKKSGEPRQKYKYWIGEMLPSDEQAGFDLANVLLDSAKASGIPKGFDGKYRMVGLNGVVSDGAAIERKKGLMRAVKNRSDVNLQQIVPANWNRKKAKSRLKGLIKRYPQTTLVWTANDGMALGVMDYNKENNKKLLTGGVDWVGEAVTAVKQGKITSTIGGHFMEAGWIAVILHDYFHGIDFKKQGTSMKSRMGILTKENVENYLAKFGKSDWSAIDFKKFSKKLNPKVKDYDFSLDAILKQF